MPNLKPDEVLLSNEPFFVDLPDGEYTKGPIFSNNPKFASLQQFISRHDPRHLRVVVQDSCAVGLIQKQDPYLLRLQAQEQEPPVAEGDDAVQTVERPMKKGPGGRMYPVSPN